MRERRARRLLTEEDTSAVGGEQALKLIAHFPNGLKGLGVDVSRAASFKVLGTGTRGTAFDLGDGRVLKVTNDAQEAQAASVMVGQDAENIVRFFGVVKFAKSGMYGILQEKLTPLDAASAKAFDAALVATAVPLWIKRAGGSWDAVKQMTKQYIVEQVKKRFKGDHNSPEAREYVRGVNEQWNLLVTTYGLRGMFETLTANGIDFHDYQAANLMRRGEQLVLIDLGMSKIRAAGGKIEAITDSTRRGPLVKSMKITLAQLKGLIAEEKQRLAEAGWSREREYDQGQRAERTLSNREPGYPSTAADLRDLISTALKDAGGKKTRDLNVQRLWLNARAEESDGLPWAEFCEHYVHDFMVDLGEDDAVVADAVVSCRDGLKQLTDEAAVCESVVRHSRAGRHVVYR